MQTIKLSTKSFWFKYWNFIHMNPSPYERPTDTCSFRRQLILSSLISLIFLPSFIVIKIFTLIVRYAEIDKSTRNISHVVLFIMGIVVFIPLTKLFPSLDNFWCAYILGPFILSVTLIILTFIMSIFAFTADSVRKIIPTKTDPEKSSFIGELYRGWKDKLCSKIEYTDEIR